MLYLPSHLLERQRQAGNTYGHYVSISMLTDVNKPEVADLVQLLASIRRDDVLRCIVQLLQILDINRQRVLDLQWELAKSFMSDERLGQLSAYATKESAWAVFHYQAIWFVLQFAILTCTDNTPAIEETGLRHSLGDAILIANDLLDGDSFDVTDDHAKYDDEVSAAILPLLEFGSAPLNIFGLSRFQTLWGEIPRGEQFGRKTRTLRATNWHEVFAQHYGISLEEFGSICAICVSFFLPDESNPKPRRMDIDRQFGSGTLRTRADSVLPLLTQTSRELALNLINKPRQSWSRDFSPLKRRPLLWLAQNVLTCPQQSFLLEKLRDGLYWLLFEAYGKLGSNFQQSFGHAFEIYVEQQLDGFSYGGQVLARDRYNSPKFKGTQDEVCDFYVDLGDAVSLWECKASLLTAHQKYSGSKEGLLNAIDDQICSEKKGAGQFAASIKRMLNGATAVCDGHHLRWNNGTQVLPVLVTYEPFHGLHSVRNRVQRKLDSFLQLDTQQVLPLVLLTIDDLELLQGLRCKDSAKNVLLNYAKYLKQNPRDSLGTFQGYLWDHYPEGRVAADNDYRTTAAKLMQTIAEEVQALANMDALRSSV